MESIAHIEQLVVHLGILAMTIIALLAVLRDTCASNQLRINNLEKCKNLLLNVGNVAKMLPVKSEGACSLTLVPGPAHLIFSGFTRAQFKMK
jgi:hypothetical protein